MNTNTSVLPAAITSLSFEDAMRELEQLVRQLEEGKTKLDDAIGAFERGTLLRRHCEAKLREAQSRIEQISLDGDGKLVTKPMA